MPANGIKITGVNLRNYVSSVTSDLPASVPVESNVCGKIAVIFFLIAPGGIGTDVVVVAGFRIFPDAEVAAVMLLSFSVPSSV